MILGLLPCKAKQRRYMLTFPNNVFLWLWCTFLFYMQMATKCILADAGEAGDGGDMRFSIDAYVCVCGGAYVHKYLSMQKHIFK